MHRSSNRAVNGNAIFVSWKVKSGETDASALQRKLRVGQDRHRLYKLRSWVILGSEGHALLYPQAAISHIMEQFAGSDADYQDRWVRGEVECARVIRFIEHQPLRHGLVKRPEQWQWSSAHSE